jgi:uncharacterized membrane protein (DUF106 family)
MTGQPLRYAWVATILFFLAMWKAVYVVLRNHSAFPASGETPKLQPGLWAPNLTDP